MKRKQNSLMLILAVLAGFMGGTISSQIPMIPTVFAQKNNKSQKVIEANEFRLIDKYGNQIASLKGKDFTSLDSKNVKVQDPVLEMKAKDGALNLTGDSLTFLGNQCISLLNFEGLQVVRVPEDTRSIICDSYIKFSHGPSEAALGLSDPPKNLPKLAITDAKGSKAVLGQVLLKNKKTGTTIERSAASLVLFDKKGNVIWSTPE